MAEPKPKPASLPGALLTQIHLIGKGHSGRAVQLRPLSLAQKGANELIVGKETTAETTVAEYNQRRDGLCVRTALVRVSPPVTAEKYGATPQAAAIGLERITCEELDGATGSRTFEALFTPKDAEVLLVWYRQNHVATQAEVDAIVGKALLVSEG